MGFNWVLKGLRRPGPNWDCCATEKETKVGVCHKGNKRGCLCLMSRKYFELRRWKEGGKNCVTSSFVLRIARQTVWRKICPDRVSSKGSPTIESEDPPSTGLCRLALRTSTTKYDWSVFPVPRSTSELAHIPTAGRNTGASYCSGLLKLKETMSTTAQVKPQWRTEISASLK